MYLASTRSSLFTRDKASLTSSHNSQFLIRYGALYVVLYSCLGVSQLPPQNATAFAEFRPRREIPGKEFVGREVCATCHAQKNRSQSHTAMAHALGTAADNNVLRSHPRMTFRAGPYSYEISSDGQQSYYRVTDGKETITEPILYVFGNAHVAQTYVLRRKDKLYEGRVSYYTGIDGLDWTIGDAQNPSPNLEEAFGRDISGDEARNCFSCHGTAAVVNNQLRLDRLVPGVTCEACHGPGGKHASTMLSGTGGEDRYIFNPKKLDPETRIARVLRGLSSQRQHSRDDAGSWGAQQRTISALSSF